MKFDIRKGNIQWSDALAGYAERRIAGSLDHVRDRVRHVLVRLSDVNGPRGGRDKHCGVVVQMAAGDQIFANATEDCAYIAVDSAVERIKRTVTEGVKRQRDQRRRAPRN